VLALHCGQRHEPLAGEALGQQRQVVQDHGAAGELVVGAVQEPLDGLVAEGAVELAGQVGGRGSQRELLVDRQVRAVVVKLHSLLRS
jgi:hypothetical protein